ncbi:hypothetical protein M0804_002093 [Polistes exclamans]|nr:hypothetical protein M0804_002093 [Polistes exclamans]
MPSSSTSSLSLFSIFRSLSLSLLSFLEISNLLIEQRSSCVALLRQDLPVVRFVNAGAGAYACAGAGEGSVVVHVKSLNSVLSEKELICFSLFTHRMLSQGQDSPSSGYSSNNAVYQGAPCAGAPRGRGSEARLEGKVMVTVGSLRSSNAYLTQTLSLITRHVSHA